MSRRSRRAPGSHEARRGRLILAHLLLTVSLLGLLSGLLSAQEVIEPVEEAEPTPEELAEQELLREGAAVYTAICSQCHQPAGIGITGQFPPLAGNARVEDAEYVRAIINNGQRGELEVDGVIYDGVMPSFSTLSDEETTAVIAYIQSGFREPVADGAVAPEVGPVAGTELPGFTEFGALVTYLLAALIALVVLAPRILGRTDRLDTPWLDAWLKTAVIVVGVVFLTVVVPDWVLRTGTVSGWDRLAQDAIGLVFWLGGLVIVLGTLWWAHRESRI